MQNVGELLLYGRSCARSIKTAQCGCIPHQCQKGADGMFLDQLESNTDSSALPFLAPDGKLSPGNTDSKEAMLDVHCCIGHEGDEWQCGVTMAHPLRNTFAVGCQAPPRFGIKDKSDRSNRACAIKLAQHLFSKYPCPNISHLPASAHRSRQGTEFSTAITGP